MNDTANERLRWGDNCSTIIHERLMYVTSEASKTTQVLTCYNNTFSDHDPFDLSGHAWLMCRKTVDFARH